MLAFSQKAGIEMSKKFSLVVASLVAFAFVFISIAHACSGLTSMNPAMQQSQMNMSADDGFPCGKAKPDICKTVRYSMLSVKPTDAGADSLGKTLSATPLSFGSSSLVSFPPMGFAIGVTSATVFRPPLSFSPVLRI
jgi:hypothetical protein